MSINLHKFAEDANLWEKTCYKPPMTGNGLYYVCIYTPPINSWWLGDGLRLPTLQINSPHWIREARCRGCRGERFLLSFLRSRFAAVRRPSFCCSWDISWNISPACFMDIYGGCAFLKSLKILTCWWRTAMASMASMVGMWLDLFPNISHCTLWWTNIAMENGHL